jgi:hypothetical protein
MAKMGEMSIGSNDFTNSCPPLRQAGKVFTQAVSFSSLRNGLAQSTMRRNARSTSGQPRVFRPQSGLIHN